MTQLAEKPEVVVAPDAPSRRRKGLRPSRVVLYVVLLIGAIPTVLPFVWLIRSALMNSNQIFTAPPEWIPKPFAWNNFSGVFTAVSFGRYFFNTFVIEFFVIVGTLFSCSLAAFSFARLRWRGRNLMFGVLLTGVMLPYAVTLIPTFMAWNKLGAINTIFPLTVPSFFASGAAFNIFLLRQFFLTIPYELDEAAYIDGANPFTVFWRIILPLSRPPLIVVSIFTFMFVWNDYLNQLTTSTTSGSSPSRSAWPPSRASTPPSGAI